MVRGEEPKGGTITIPSAPAGLPVRWFDAKAGEFRDADALAGGRFTAPDDRPWVLFAGQRRKS